jgi:UTP--glucose-1-phosphate uridylyltransferase
VAAITDAVIPVGGLGTRLLPATRSQPKEMLPLVDKPVVQYVVEELVRAGIARVLFVTGRRKRAIEDHFDADPELDTAPLIDPRTGLQVFYTRQARPAGLGDAIRYAQGFADDRAVVVALGDAVIVSERPSAPGIVARLIEAFEASDGAAAAFAVADVPRELVSRYGIAVVSDGSTVRDLVEKPSPDAAPSTSAIMGRYVLGPAVFRALRKTRPDASGEVQLTDALRQVLADGASVLAVPLSAEERRLDIGSVEGYCAAFLEHALTDPRFGGALRARAADLLDARG